jgi:acyl transferase domain-containing protein
MQRDDAAFLFSAQGGQWPGMGAALYRDQPEFRQTILRCDEVVRKLLGWSLVDELTRDPASWEMHRRPELIQPGLTAIQLALSALLRVNGIEATAVLGLSMGEVAAAHTAGALDLEDAMRVVCTQARLTRHSIRPGGMIVAAVGAAAAREAASHEPDVVVAVELAPRSTVLSGEASAISRTAARLSASGAKVTPVPIGFAFHSGEVAPLRDEFFAALSALRPRRTELPFFSAACGGRADGTSLGSEHWWRIMCGGALFVSAVEAAIDAGFHTFFEIGPHPMLEDSIHAIAREHSADVTYRAVMHRGERSAASFNTAVGSFQHQ